MTTLVEIEPSNASQRQHRRKDATEQIKNLTLAGSRAAELYNGINSGQLTKKSLSHNMSSIIGPHEGKATG